MVDLLTDHYLLLKALHLIAVMSWMAVLLYLPRLFVYHVDAVQGSEQSETFKIMEYRLIRFIGMPAMIATWVFALLMIWANPGLFAQGWMHAKLMLVIAMTGIHHVFLAWVKRFAHDANEKTARFYRIANEIPTLLMIAIVVLAVVKPF